MSETKFKVVDFCKSSLLNNISDPYFHEAFVYDTVFNSFDEALKEAHKRAQSQLSFAMSQDIFDECNDSNTITMTPKTNGMFLSYNLSGFREHFYKVVQINNIYLWVADVRKPQAWYINDCTIQLVQADHLYISYDSGLFCHSISLEPWTPQIDGSRFVDFWSTEFDKVRAENMLKKAVHDYLDDEVNRLTKQLNKTLAYELKFENDFSWA